MRVYIYQHIYFNIFGIERLLFNISYTYDQPDTLRR